MRIDGRIGTPVIMHGGVILRTAYNTCHPDGSRRSAVNGNITGIAAIVEIEGGVVNPTADTADIDTGAALVSGDIDVAGITGILCLDTGGGVTGDTADAEISAITLGRAGSIGNATTVDAVLAGSTGHVEITAAVPTEQTADADVLGAAGVLDIT